MTRGGRVELVVRRYGEGVALVEWAASTAERHLSPLGRRWIHVRAVAGRAAEIAHLLPSDEGEVLIAAAFLHDIGYAPALAVEGFHPLDGARFVRSAGQERLSRLVAHHSGARFEAKLRGYPTFLEEFPREESLTAVALTYCDMTTGPAGQHVTVSERVEEINQRYSPDHVTARAISCATPEFLRWERLIEELLGAASAGAA